jgi:hypothetical protein
MPWGSSGHRGWPAAAGGVLTPTELNNVYTHGQFWVPAGALTGNGVQSPNFALPYQIPSGYSSYTVARYADVADDEAFFTWAFKSDFPAVPSASLLLKLFPLFTCENTIAAPNNKVQLAFAASNVLIGNSLDYDASGDEVFYNTTAPVSGVLQGGDTSDPENAISVPVANNVLSANNMNFVQILVERHSGSGGADDNYAAEIVLFGVAVQWAVDFNNLGVWPT